MTDDDHNPWLSYLPRTPAVPPSSCEELRNYPYNQRSGYYMFRDTTDGLLAVWCDMDLPIADMQTTIGKFDVKTSNNSFSMGGYKNYSTIGTNISYDF